MKGFSIARVLVSATLIAIAVLVALVASSAQLVMRVGLDTESTPTSSDPSGNVPSATLADSVSQEGEAVADAADASFAGERPEYEEGSLLVRLADGFSAGDLLACCAADPFLAGSTVVKQGEGYVKLSLPSDEAVEDAVPRLATVAPEVDAQPNYRYYPVWESTAESAGGVRADGRSLTTAATTALERAAVTVQATASDPYYQRQWALSSINAPAAWSLVDANVGTSSAPTIAVIDEGFRVNHHDLKGHVVDYYNVASSSTSVGDDHAAHGTHVAGIAAAVTNNREGIAGTANNACGLMLLRVSNSRGEITTDALVDAYAYLVKRAKLHNVRVVNLSLGAYSHTAVSRSSDPELYDAISKARGSGIVTVAAASNADDGADPPFYNYPGDFDNVVSVINLSRANNSDGVQRDSSSNYNKPGDTGKNISAPGTDIISLGGSSNVAYGTETGTSMSTPVVAGVFGLMFAVSRNLTATQATEKLYSSARDLTACKGATKGWDRVTGYGEVDAAAAVRAAGAKATTSKTSVSTLSISAADRGYSGKAVKPEVKVVDGSKTLRRGVDYTVSYRDNKKKGKATYTVVGKGNYCGIAVGTFTISKLALKSVKLVSRSAIYDGAKHKPAIKMVKSYKGKVKRSGYSVKYLRNGKKTTDFKSAGVITVKVTGKKKYADSVTKDFRIKPKKTRITSLRAKGDGFAVHWKKRARQTSGYQLQYATNKKFTAHKTTITSTARRITKKTVRGLIHKRTYYVRIRTFKATGNKRACSGWSAVCAVKTR